MKIYSLSNIVLLILCSVFNSKIYKIEIIKNMTTQIKFYPTEYNKLYFLYFPFYIYIKWKSNNYTFIIFIIIDKINPLIQRKINYFHFFTAYMCDCD